MQVKNIAYLVACFSLFFLFTFFNTKGMMFIVGLAEKLRQEVRKMHGHCLSHMPDCDSQGLSGQVPMVYNIDECLASTVMAQTVSHISHLIRCIFHTLTLK